MISIKSFIQRLIVFLYLIFAILTDITTTAQKVFPLAGLFEILRVSTIAILPRVLVTFVEARITVSRIQEFLLSEYDYEYKENMKIKKVKRTTEELIFSGANGTYDNKIISDSKHLRKGILARDISVKWNPSSTSYALEKLTLSVSPKQLIAIVGAAGSGKTTVLNTILKEIPLLNGTLEVRGTISYSSQEAWIFASTIKQNILFGQALDANKYRKVVKVCALEHDFSLFPYGENTVVGERGVMLSGGQKARINLARAVYTDADIYLLDDPLAAVDAHVATHLFNECILGYLKEKCVILVTHQIQYLDKANRIYLLEKGHVAAEGRYDELTTQQNEIFLKIAQQDSDTQRAESNAETETIPLNESKNFAKSKIEESNLTVNNGFKGYFTNDGNWIFTVAFFLLCVLLQALCLFSDYMVVVYVDLAQEQDKNNTIVSVNLDKEKPVKFFTLNSCLYIYGALIITIVIVTGIRALVYVKFSMQVARKLHTKMFLQIIRGAMKFFDTHQSGEILNRFAEDVGTVDENLPLALMETVQSFFTLIGVLILISILNYWLIIAMVVLVILFVFFAWIIIPVSRTKNKIEARSEYRQRFQS
jgi:ATP-binding cassette subfamily C (CFTR/MRP) protein 4